MRVELNDITPNPLLHKIANQFLNSLWEKFGQSDDLLKDEFIYGEHANSIYVHFDSAQVTITEPLVFIGQHHVLLSLEMQDECDRKNDPIFYIAEFFSAHARLRQY